MLLVVRRERAEEAFGQGEKFLGVGDLLPSLIGCDSMGWPIVSTMPQILCFEEKAMEVVGTLPVCAKC
jgi:hypothetical protein